MTGRCLCGGVRFELTAPPVAAGYCHCTRCQRRTGTAASPSALIEPGSFRFLSGEELVRSWTPPDDGFVKAFCGQCGSALYTHRQGDPTPVGVRMGAFDEDPGVRPQWRQHLASAAPWEPVPEDGLTRFDGPRS